jgi:hypothetical protein
MYALYEKILAGSGYRYLFKKKVSLFGCNSGFIPRLLKVGLDSASSQPLPWHVNIEEGLSSVGQHGNTLVIDLKPNSSKPNLSLYEISDVWGYSSCDWTRLMFYLRGLFVDDDPSAFDKTDFIRCPAEIDEPIFSMIYLRGTVKGGVIEGRWTPPRPSSTNSVLLRPEAFKYFAEKAREIMERMTA